MPSFPSGNSFWLLCIVLALSYNSRGSDTAESSNPLSVDRCPDFKLLRSGDRGVVGKGVS